MMSAAQNSLAAFRLLPLPSEMKTSTFSILPIVISQSFRQHCRYLTLSQAACCCCYFSTFSIPKNEPINGQAISPPFPLSPLGPHLPLCHFSRRQRWASKKTVMWEGCHSSPCKADRAKNDHGRVWFWEWAWKLEKFLFKKFGLGWQWCSALVRLESTWSIGYF